jgi:Terpene cyclase DEP1
MTGSLVFYGILGVASTAVAFVVNRRLFTEGGAGGPTLLEALYFLFGAVSLGLGWYFNVRYTHQYGHRATYVGYTKALFSNWAADSAAQDYIMVNLVLLPLWTIVDGRRRGLRAPWIFFVMSLFTSLAFAMAFYLAFVERQIRFARRQDTDALAAPAPVERGLSG